MTEDQTYFVTSPSEAREVMFLMGQLLGTYGAEAYDHGKKFQINVEVTEIT